jgi:hypothetical protein
MAAQACPPFKHLHSVNFMLKVLHEENVVACRGTARNAPAVVTRWTKDRAIAEAMVN